MLLPNLQPNDVIKMEELEYYSLIIKTETVDGDVANKGHDNTMGGYSGTFSITKEMKTSDFSW